MSKISGLIETKSLNKQLPSIVPIGAVIGLALLIVLALQPFQRTTAETRDKTQAPAINFTNANLKSSPDLERAMFAGGCFWGTQYAFSQLPGVEKTLVGYAGGNYAKPTYEDVCAHKTGHAETVYVEFNPRKLSYKQLVDYFWTLHDPTTKDRQGVDFGSQYRSGIFYTSKEQKAIAEDSMQRAQKSGKFRDKIVTLIEPATVFYPAEEYHQNFDIKHGSLSCPVPRSK